jgi:NRPS condensation-like uncharacterized protein
VTSALQTTVPFSVADELSCYYDAPAEPCTVHLELQVPGHLDQTSLRLAVGAALAAQPRAMVRRAAAHWWRRGGEWEQPGGPDIDPVASAAWADEDDLSRVRSGFLSTSPALDSSPPLRILLATGPGEDRVILNAHHAALDGVSCLELLSAVSRHYRDAAAYAPAPLPAAPAGPGSPGAATVLAHQPRPPVAQAPAAARLAGALPRPATRIAADHQGSSHGAANHGASNHGAANHGAAGSRPGYGFRLLRLPVPGITGHRQEPRPTVNDLLIAALVVAVGRWNSSHGRSPGRIRITMPVNARSPGQASATGNLSRLTAVTVFPPSDHRDLARLLADVTAQTRWAKDHTGPQVDPLSSALARAWCPAGVKRRLLRLALRTAGPLLCDTSLVSNLGLVAQPPRFGQAETTGMWFSTSAHMPRGLSVGAISLGRQLHLCLRYRLALFSEPAASEFAGAYAAALNDVTGLAVSDGSGEPASTASGQVASQGSPA